MRDRHLPRLCPACRAPAARQEHACWACGTDWPADEQSPVTGGTGAGGDRMRSADLRPRAITVARAAAIDANRSSESDRWTDEGGSVVPDADTRRGTGAPAR